MRRMHLMRLIDRALGTEVAGSVSTVVDTSIYSLDALHRTCYAFTDRAHIRLERIDDTRVAVMLGPLPSQPLSDGIVAEFENALLDHRIRADVSRETSVIRDLIYRQAFIEADL